MSYRIQSKPAVLLESSFGPISFFCFLFFRPLICGLLCAGRECGSWFPDGAFSFYFTFCDDESVSPHGIFPLSERAEIFLELVVSRNYLLIDLRPLTVGRFAQAGD
jgi:hypothetical protein